MAEQFTVKRFRAQHLCSKTPSQRTIQELAGLLAKAEIVAQEIKEAAQAEAVTIRKLAMTTAQSEADKKVRELLEQCRREEKSQQILRAESYTQALFLVCEEVLAEAPNVQAAAIQKRVTRALEQVPIKQKIEIRVNPEDIAYIATDRFSSENPTLAIIEDDTLARGDTVLQSPIGEIALQPLEHLQRIRNLYLDGTELDGSTTA